MVRRCIGIVVERYEEMRYELWGHASRELRLFLVPGIDRNDQEFAAFGF